MSLFNIYGPLNDLGYGQFTTGLISGFFQSGLRLFHLNPIGPIQLENENLRNTLIQHGNSIPWSRNNVSVAIWHEFDLSKFSGKKLIAFPIFETNNFFPLAKHHLKQMDAICVASKWAKDVVENSIGTNIPVFVVPGGADILVTDRIAAVKRNSCFTFLFVGKYEQRKSPIEIIQAYLAAFQNSKAETRLICHCYNPFDQQFRKNISVVLTQLGLQLIESTCRSSIIASRGNCIVEVPDGRISKEQLFCLYKYCHVGVFPSKGEGWNLPLMEAIQSGLPCIATNYSAHTEYLTTEFDYPQDLLLNNFKMDTAFDGVYFKGDRGQWAVPDLGELATKMQYVYREYESISNRFNNTKLINEFTWKNSSIKLLKVIQSISD